MPIHVLKADLNEESSRLDIYLTAHLPGEPSRSFVQRLVAQGAVTLNGQVVKSHHKIYGGDDIVVDIPIPELQGLIPEDIALDILYEDADLLVINKPSGMTVHPAKGVSSGTLVNALLYHVKKLSDVNQPERPGIVHRLDKDTSGVMVVAKHNRAHVRLARQFEKRRVQKQYLAIVEGVVEHDEGMIDAALGRHPTHHEKKTVTYHNAKDAVTHYRVIRRLERSTVVALFPKTGRTHQLRVHMAHLGHPILGDEKYGKKGSFHRLALHAQFLSFLHPEDKKPLSFSAALPEEFLKYGR